MIRKIGLIIAILSIITFYSLDFENSAEMVQVATPHVESPVRAEFEAYGQASWYSYELNGIEWSKTHRTAASRTFPRYSTVKVTNQANGKSVEVFINDFGPEEWTGREIDLSSYAFSLISDLKLGLADVKIELKN